MNLTNQKYNLGFNLGTLSCKYYTNLRGFNGQEKETEITGTESHYSAEFWMYDSRLGRRWNVDPVDKPWESPYACLFNNPIRIIDPNGDDGYVDEDGNYLGDDGSTESNETRVITADKWNEIVGETKLEDFTDEMRTNLQTNIEIDNEGNQTGTSKLLSEYEKGISISDETWDKLVENGGTRLTPWVQNQSNETVYYKPEGNGSYVENDGAYPIGPKLDLYIAVDGVKTSKTGAGDVHKVPTGSRVKIESDGTPDIIGWCDWCVPGFGDTSKPTDGTWDALEKSK